MAVRGYGGSFGVGQESTWGTEVARAVWLHALTVGVQKKITQAVTGNLGAYGSLSTVDLADVYTERIDVMGPLVYEFAYNGGGATMLRHMFGTVADSGAGPYAHTYKITSPPPVGMSLSLIYGTDAVLSTGREAYGCKIGSWEIACESGKRAIVTTDIVGRSASDVQAAESPTYGTPTYVQHNHLSTLFTANSVTEGVNKFSLKVNRNFQIHQELGSLFISEPIETRTTIELDLEMLWQKSTPHTNYEAGNMFDWTWGFSSGSLSAAFTLFNGVIFECDSPTNSAEGIRQSLKIRGFADGGSGDQGLQLILTNANALYTAN